jgi:hypothetical protein
MSNERPLSQDQNNAPKGGIAKVPGSRALQELAKFEQFHSEWTAGTKGPGNPYVYRPYPKMLYRAEAYNGKNVCMATPPDPYTFKTAPEYARAEESAKRFTEKCQRIVQDEVEHQKAAESGWRESPQEAVEYLEARTRAVSDATAHRNYEDRNMSDAAKREIADQVEAAGGEHQPEIKRKPGRPKGSKNKR